jgi:hypothetical protein
MATLVNSIKKYVRKHFLTPLRQLDVVEQMLLRIEKSRRARNESVQMNVTGPVDKSILIAGRYVTLQGRLGIKPVLFILASILISLVALSYSQLNSPTVEHFAHGSSDITDFVIPPFVVVGDTAKCDSFGHDISTSAGGLIKRWLDVSELKDVSAGVQVWVPSQVDSLQVRVGESYDQAVERFAAEHGADVVFYGILSCDTQTITLESHVYLSAAKGRDSWNLIGSYILDPYVNRIDRPNDSVSAGEIYSWLSERARALVLLSQSIQLYNRHTQADYLKAARLLERLGGSVALNDQHLMTVARLLTANAYAHASMNDCGQVDRSEYLQRAMDHYILALEANYQPERAYLGLAIVMNNLALEEDDSNLAEQDLRRANEFLGIATLDAATSQNEPLKWHILFARAQSKMIDHDLATDPSSASRSLEEAKSLLTLVLGAYTDIDATDLYRRSVTAYAYFAWGGIQTYYSNESGALSAYEKAQALAPETDTLLKTQVALQVGKILTNRGDMCGAVQQYRTAALNNMCREDQPEILQMVYALQYECWK